MRSSSDTVHAKLTWDNRLNTSISSSKETSWFSGLQTRFQRLANHNGMTQKYQEKERGEYLLALDVLRPSGLRERARFSTLVSLSGCSAPSTRLLVFITCTGKSSASFHCHLLLYVDAKLAILSNVGCHVIGRKSICRLWTTPEEIKEAILFVRGRARALMSLSRYCVGDQN